MPVFHINSVRLDSPWSPDISIQLISSHELRSKWHFFNPHCEFLNKYYFFLMWKSNVIRIGRWKQKQKYKQYLRVEVCYQLSFCLQERRKKLHGNIELYTFFVLCEVEMLRLLDLSSDFTVRGSRFMILTVFWVILSEFNAGKDKWHIFQLKALIWRKIDGKWSVFIKNWYKEN